MKIYRMYNFEHCDYFFERIKNELENIYPRQRTLTKKSLLGKNIEDVKPNWVIEFTPFIGGVSVILYNKKYENEFIKVCKKYDYYVNDLTIYDEVK